MKKQGILLFNLGGPETLDEVKPFLYRLFKDPYILVGIPAPLRQIMAFMISRLKGPSSQKMYEKIGGGSPQLKWTQAQARGLEARLVHSGEAIKVTIGMAAWNPSIKEGLEKLRKWGADEVTLLPLFPQYSTTTSEACFSLAKKALRKMNWSPKLRHIRSWPDHPRYIESLKTTVSEALADMKERDASPVYVLFSAHSLPMKIIQKGDPYPKEVERTVKAVAQDLTEPYSLAFQSRNGPIPWLKPYTEDEIVRLAKQGIRRLLIVPISFVSDHIETLFEIDQQYAHLAKRAGIRDYARTRSFNDDPKFLDSLASIVGEAKPDFPQLTL